MRIELVRTGGVAGVTLRCAVDTADLPAADAADLEQLVSAADLPAVAARPAIPPRGADRFQYDLTVDDGETRHAVRVRDGDLPPSLRPLIDRLLALARRS